jgi:hypothetical protein
VVRQDILSIAPRQGILPEVELWGAPIWKSARRHGIDDEEIRHALRNFIAQSDDTGDDDVTLFIGPDATGNLVEVGVLSTEDGPVVIHAMPGRINRFFPR